MRGIGNGDYCRLYNDRGEVFGHALIVDGLLPGVIAHRSNCRGPGNRWVNVNALISQREADMGAARCFSLLLRR